MTGETIIACVLSSTLAAAIVTAIKDLLLAKRKRKETLEDRDEEKKANVSQYLAHQHLTDEKLETLIKEVHEYISSNNALMNNIVSTNRLILRDRIKFIATSDLKKGRISYEDRKLLHDMWDEYHNDWHGNGDLDLVMRDIDELPLEMK